MKNILHIDSTNACQCDLLSNVNDGTNKIVLDINADLSLNPTLIIGDTSIDIDTSEFGYEIPSSRYIGSGVLTFYVEDDVHTGEEFQISKVSSLDGNLLLKQTSNFVYTLSLITEGGSSGSTVSVQVGSTTTLPAGNQASVSNSGNEQNVVLDFSIPQGAKGDTGSQGPQGPQGPAGSIATPTTTTYTISANDVISSGTITVQKASVICHVYGQLTLTGKAAAWIELTSEDFVLPGIADSTKHMYISVNMGWGTSGTAPAVLRLSPAGNLVIQYGQSGTCNFSFTYLCDDDSEPVDTTAYVGTAIVGTSTASGTVITAAQLNAIGSNNANAATAIDSVKTEMGI